MRAHKEIIIALDEGTTNAKAVALDGQGKVIAKYSRPLTIDTPRDGWVEQSGEMLVEASPDVLARAIAEVGGDNVAARAISKQRETDRSEESREGQERRACAPVARLFPGGEPLTASFMQPMPLPVRVAPSSAPSRKKGMRRSSTRSPSCPNPRQRMLPPISNI